MEITAVAFEEYSRLISAPFHQYGTAAFNDLNGDKADAVYYLLFKDSKFRLGIIGGTRNNIFHSPFSAPFGGFSFLQEDVRISHIDEAIQLLSDWAVEKKLAALKITLPPFIYQESFLSKQMNSLFRNGFNIDKTDLNYSFNLGNFDENYAGNIWYNARKNLKIAQSNQLSFRIAVTPGEKDNAYEVIKQNRDARGFPLRMTKDQVHQTTGLLKADYFLVENNTGDSVAAAIVFYVSKYIVQVVYWGDLPQYAGLKTMNFLSFKVFEYYSLLDIKIVDIGPSTENSIPNYGLCEFKESIGANISCKFSLSKSIN